MTEEEWLFAMPESHWLEPSDPHFVNLFIRLQNQTSQRKVRLAAGACARQNRAFMKLFGADCAVDAIDKVADECGTLKDLKQAVSNLGIASKDPEFGPLRKSINISLCSEHSLTHFHL